MIPSADTDGDLPPGIHEAPWNEFQNRFCIFSRSDRRLRICQNIGLLIQEARSSQIVESVIFGGSFVTQKSEPNDFDCIVVLKREVDYGALAPSQLWVAETKQASRRYNGDVFVARANHILLAALRSFLETNRNGKNVGLVEVRL